MRTGELLIGFSAQSAYIATSGFSGTSGSSGSSGSTGPVGSTGSSGLSGFSGSAGSSGSAGPAGDSGTSGFSGQAASGAISLVAIRYNSTASQSIPNDTATVVGFENEDYDTDNAVTGSGTSWLFTVPSGKGGNYHVETFVRLSNDTGWEDGEIASLDIYLNDTAVAKLDRFEMPASGSGSLSVALQGGTILQLDAGDELTVKVRQTSDGAITLVGSANDVWVSIQQQASSEVSGFSGTSGSTGISGFSGATGSLPFGYIAGLTTSVGTDTDHDIDIAVGSARSTGDTADLKLTSGLTKQIDASWAAGTNQGGMFTGSVASLTTYHLFLIRKDSDGSIDAGFDTSASAANIPSGYTAYRRIASVLTNGSANIRGYTQQDDSFYIDSVRQDYSTSNPGTSATLRAVTVPTGIKVIALHVFALQDGDPASNTEALVTGPDQTDDTPSSSKHTVRLLSGTAQPTESVFIQLLTDTSGQIRTRLSNSDAGVAIRGYSYGWIDARDKNS